MARLVAFELLARIWFGIRVGVLLNLLSDHIFHLLLSCCLVSNEFVGAYCEIFCCQFELLKGGLIVVSKVHVRCL